MIQSLDWPMHKHSENTNVNKMGKTVVEFFSSYRAHRSRLNTSLVAQWHRLGTVSMPVYDLSDAVLIPILR